jgi:hypothetical protein
MKAIKKKPASACRPVSINGKPRASSRKENLPRHVFLCAWEKQEAALGEDRTPALYCIEIPMLHAFAELYKMGKPPERLRRTRFADGPIVWNEELGELTFYAWYWSHQYREFIATRFLAAQTGEKFSDGNPAIKLIGLGESKSNSEVLQSIKISAEALGLLLDLATIEQKFVIAGEEGVASFREFAEFEHLFLNAVEDAFGCGIEYCTMPEAEL